MLSKSSEKKNDRWEKWDKLFFSRLDYHWKNYVKGLKGKYMAHRLVISGLNQFLYCLNSTTQNTDILQQTKIYITGWHLIDNTNLFSSDKYQTTTRRHEIKPICIFLLFPNILMGQKRNCQWNLIIYIYIL